MRPPLPANSPIDDTRQSGWLTSFSGYHNRIDAHSIESWLAQFGPHDQDLAARVLDAVLFLPPAEMANRLRTGLFGLPGWGISPAARIGRWRFAAFSSSAGESGDSMLHLLRRSAGLSAASNGPLFIYKSELFKEQLSPNDTVVFVDDFAGTGDQATTAWTENISELLPRLPTVYLLLVAANEQAIARIESSTPLRVVPSIRLGSSEDVFSPACPHFTDAEKGTILSYNAIADPRRPRGYGACGNLIVFAHNAPNNSIPVLRASHKKWQGLFRIAL